MGIELVYSVPIFVNDQEAARAFYTETLGFKLRQDSPFGDGQRWLEVAPPGSATAFILVKGFGGWRPERVGVDTGITLTTSDLQGTVAALKEGGVTTVQEPYETPWGRFANIKDGDGNVFLLHESVPRTG